MKLIYKLGKLLFVGLALSFTGAAHAQIIVVGQRPTCQEVMLDFAGAGGGYMIWTCDDGTQYFGGGLPAGYDQLGQGGGGGGGGNSIHPNEQARRDRCQANKTAYDGLGCSSKKTAAPTQTRDIKISSSSQVGLWGRAIVDFHAAVFPTDGHGSGEWEAALQGALTRCQGIKECQNTVLHYFGQSHINIPAIGMEIHLGVAVFQFPDLNALINGILVHIERSSYPSSPAWNDVTPVSAVQTCQKLKADLGADSCG